MTRPAIYEPAITQYVADGRELVQAICDAESAASKLDKQLGEAREAAQMRRLEMGTLLLKVRESLPRRGTRENGWLAYLEAIEVDDSTAHRYMELAKNPSARSQVLQSRSSGDQPDAPPHGDADAPDATGDASAEDLNPDRDTWCTPKWLAEALGHWGLDPCSNERSHIESTRACRLDLGQDGLVLAPDVDDEERVFINPPYSDVTPWVQAYKRTNFCFLLKFDPSTKWCAELLKHTELVLFAKLTRIEFEPMPGVGGGAVQFPHALFFKRATDATSELLDLCFQFTPTAFSRCR